jgi:hypothetical protein
MATLDERRELLIALCDACKATAGPIVEHCDALLQQTHGSLTEEQTSDISLIRKSAQRLLSRLEELNQANQSGIYLDLEPHDFGLFSRSLLQELRNPLVVMLSYLELVSGQFNDKQQGLIQEVRHSCLTLKSTFDNYAINSDRLFS